MNDYIKDEFDKKTIKILLSSSSLLGILLSNQKETVLTF